MSLPPRGRWTAGFLLLLAITGSNLACRQAGPTPAPTGTPTPSERVQLQTKNQTKYYNVGGLNSDSIFDSVKRNGPVDDAGQRGIGLTEVKWSYEWKGANNKEGC